MDPVCRRPFFCGEMPHFVRHDGHGGGYGKGNGKIAPQFFHFFFLSAPNARLFERSEKSVYELTANIIKKYLAVTMFYFELLDLFSSKIGWNFSPFFCLPFKNTGRVGVAHEPQFGTFNEFK